MCSGASSNDLFNLRNDTELSGLVYVDTAVVGVSAGVGGGREHAYVVAAELPDALGYVDGSTGALAQVDSATACVSRGGKTLSGKPGLATRGEVVVSVASPKLRLCSGLSGTWSSIPPAASVASYYSYGARCVGT